MEKRHLERSEEVTESTRDETPSSSGHTSGQTRGFDDVIIKVANAVSDDGDLRRLGLELGVQTPDINRALETNWAGGRKTSNGNVMMLHSWAETVKPSNQLSILRAALQAVGLKEIKETCLPRKGKHGEMPDHVQRLRTKLRARYIEEFSEVKVSPMDPESRTWLQHIFVSLILMLGCNSDQEQPIEYENLFSFIQTKTEKGFITRVAFLGEAGVGKSTLFAKIALDWAMGKCLQDITVLFHESFRDIEDSPFFGNIVMKHFPDDTEIIGEWIDKYIKENQRKVLILLDGMDEAKMDIKIPNRKLAIVSIVKRERFIDTSVLISTRPFGADPIKSIQKIHEKYCCIQVKGFTKENRNKYIKQYFNNDRASASSLIHFMNTNSVVSEYMAPFPIFCCMLCYMWKVESKRETTENLQTVSQLMKEMDFALREQYSSRYTDNEEGYQCHMEKAAEAIVKVGCVAFEGLLKNQFIFTKEEMEACDGSAAIACHVGILSGEKRLASRKIRQRDGKQFIQEFSFPHKLLQEHTASLYIASLYNHSRSEFNIILTHTLIKDYRAFKYVLYFTAAHGGEVGKSVLEALCKKVDDMEFIIRAAFECHDSEAIDPVRNLLKTKAHLVLFRHIPFTTLAFTLETMGKEVVRRSSSIRESLGVSRSLKANASSSHEAAVGLFTLQDLRHLDIMLGCLDDEFYTGMSAAASQSKIEELTHEYAVLGSVASSHYARGLCLMPTLRSLKLCNAELSDEFYSTMACKASNSKIEELNYYNAELGSAASSHYARGLCSMPNLRSLTLAAMMLSDKFYLTMASESSKSKIEKLTLGYMDLGSAAKGLCFMPTLRSLGLTSVKMSDEFYSTMASEVSKSKIEKLTHGYADLGSVASSHYARGLCSMPNLRSLKLYDVGLSDEFYSTMACDASKSKIEELNHKHANLGSAASSHYARGICFLPNLRSLTLDDVKLSDEFYSTMATESSKSKIQTLSMLDVSVMSPRRLDSILSLPRLQSLALGGIGRIDMDDGETLTRQTSSVDELFVEGKHVTSLWYLGLHTSCPRIKTLKLDWSAEENVSSDIVTMACCPFHHLTHLCIQGMVTMGIATRLNDPVSFCKAVITSCPRLTELSISRNRLYNEKAAEIIQLLKTHPHLTSIELNECGTNADLDPLVYEVNSEGKVTVTAKHGVFNMKFIEKAAKITQLMETHPHPISIDGQTSGKTHGFDDVIIKVANVVSDDGDIRRLGLELGVQTPDINMALETNWAGGTKRSNGNVMMLQNWAETVKPSKQLPILRAALQAAGLTEIEETCLSKKSKYHSEGIFDQTGGELEIPAYGVTLSIPPGALQEGSSEMITLDVLTDIPPEITLRHDETLVTYGFQCLPSGLQFVSEKPVRLKIPHCANLIDPTKVQVVLYFWNHEGEADRIVQTSRTCRVTCNHVEVLLEHFTIGFLAFADLFSMGSKRMSFMPFLPKIMPECGISIPLQFRMVNKPHGISWRVVHDIREEDEYQPVKDKDDEMDVKRKDMEVTCQLNDNDTCRKNVAVCHVRKPRHIVYFKLDWKAEDVFVRLEVIQPKLSLEIMFRTRYLASRITKTPTSSASTSVAILPQGASAGADKVSTSQTSDDVSDGQLNTLAAHIHPGKYNELSLGLGIEYDEASVILKKHGSDSKLAMRECLSMWKNSWKSGGSFTELNRIFDNVELGGLWTKHMNKT